MEEVKILVGMPAGQQLSVYTTRSLMEWQRYRKYPSQFRFKIDTYIEKARNELVWDAVDNKATHLMFIDSDMVFSPNAIDHMVDQHKDIIGGLYFGRMHPKPLAFKINEHGMRESIDPQRERGVFEVDFIGTGFMLIDIRVFAKVDPPWFRFSYEPEKFGIKTKDKIAPSLGEDAYFCLRAKQHGFHAWCDSTFELGHVGTHIYYKHDWDVYKTDKELYERT